MATTATVLIIYFKSLLKEKANSQNMVGSVGATYRMKKKNSNLPAIAAILKVVFWTTSPGTKSQLTLNLVGSIGVTSIIVQVIFYFLWDHWAHPDYLKIKFCLPGVGGEGGGGGMGAYVATQTTVLHMKRRNQTESPIFVIFCVLCFRRQSF